MSFRLAHIYSATLAGDTPCVTASLESLPGKVAAVDQHMQGPCCRLVLREEALTTAPQCAF